VSYLGDSSAVPGLLFFSDYFAPELSDPCDFDPVVEPIINMAGNSGNLKPIVYHEVVDGVDCPDAIEGCYVPSSNMFVGLIYAPNGRVATSGGRTTYIGSIVSYTVDVNGNDNLFVNNNTITSGEPRLSLVE
jgi:hypothetical protein